MTDFNLPSGAPFSHEQRSWLAGFLAGVQAGKEMGGSTLGVAPSTAGMPLPTLDILYGTQTGNAEALAEEAAELATARGYAPRIAELDAIELEQLSSMHMVLVIVSTYGEGEMPDNAHQFWEAVNTATAPRLESLNFAVIALGDSSYEHFCQAGKLIDMRFEQLGAARLAERLDCDLDFEDPAAAWLDTTLVQSQAAAVPAGAAAGETAGKAKKSAWNRKNPYASTMVDNRVLSGQGSAKEIRHLAFDLGDSGMSYEAGDALSVMPVNDPSLVTALLERLGASAEDQVAGQEASMGQMLTHQFEIMTPSRELIRALAPMVKDDEFTHVVSNGDKEALEAFLWGKDTLDLLNLSPGLALDPETFVSWLKPLQHRAYSISSSPNAHAGEVHLTVAAVRWQNTGREHRGVCSTFLADHVPEGTSAGIFMSPNKSFRVPSDDSAPMIMVGPGTGIAPFRAFLEERQARGASGENWLFFGDQHRATDFIYEGELSAFSDDGILHRLDLAFSRDQKQKIYVQHRMLENGADLFAKLEEGGSFYVCGDATRMAKDVDAALHEVVAQHGGISAEKAKAYVNELKKQKRYVRDVY